MSGASETGSGTGTPSRRGFLLAGAGAVVVAAGAGTAAALLQPAPRDAGISATAPAVLAAALAGEYSLIATIDAMGAPADLAHLRADHVEHRDAVLAALRQAAGVPTPLGTPSGTSATGPKPTLSDLSAAEQAASAAAARAAARLSGPDAALLASISACEASHVELLR